MSNHENKVGIIALGLIGGSLLKCLSNNNLKIIAVSSNPNTIEKAKKYTPFVSSDFETLQECNVVFVCTPINKTIETLDKLENIVKKECIVADTASVKEFVMQKKRPYKFIGSHPMAGTEHSGFDASFKELFIGAKWILTPNNKTSSEDIQTLENIIKLTGAKTLITDAKEHDYAAALISHLPMLISQAIFESASKNHLALKLAAGGFRDMTRLAMSNTVMAKDMIDYNNENIQKAYEAFEKAIDYLQKNDYVKKISELRQDRSAMYSKDGKNIL